VLPADKTFSFAIARIVMAFMFILFQHPIFFLLSKIVLLGRIIVVNDYSILLEVICLMFEILMCLVWVLTK